MSAAPLRMGRLVRADVRFHRGGFVGVAVAIFVATMLVTGLGVLVESGIRGGLAPERYTQVDVVVGASQQAESTAPAEPPPGVPDGVPVPPSGDLPISLPERAVLPDGAAGAVAAVPGVASVVADVTVPLVDAAGLVVEAHPWSATALSAVALRDGRAPEAADEVVMVAGPGVEIGVTVLLAHGGERAEYRVVGVLAETGAATRAQHVYLSDDRIAELDPHGGAAQVLGVFVAEGAAPDEVAEAIRAAVPGLSAQTGAGRGDIEFLDSGAARMTLIAIGSAFVGTCILVALFIVAGTLSLSVQARRRDFALLRAVGASPRQVHSLIAREVLSVAGVAAVLGILPGYLLSTALQTAFVQGGVIPGDFALAISPIPAAGALLLVLGSAWGAAAIAARRPARLDPVEALRESATGARSIGLPRIIVGIVLAAAGVSLSTVPLVARGEYARGAAAGAAMVLIVALAVLGPWLVGLVMRLLGAVLRRTTAAGFLAAENSIANSRRMASAILPLALGIGLGLVQVGAPAIVAAEAAAQAEAGVTADLRVSAQAGISMGALGVVSDVPGVTQVNPVTVSMAALDYRDLDGSPMIGEHTLQGIAPDAVSDTLDLRVQSGGPGGAGRRARRRGEHRHGADAGGRPRRHGQGAVRRRNAAGGGGRRDLRAGARVRRPHDGGGCRAPAHDGRSHGLRARRGGRRRGIRCPGVARERGAPGPGRRRAEGGGCRCAVAAGLGEPRGADRDPRVHRDRGHQHSGHGHGREVEGAGAAAADRLVAAAGAGDDAHGGRADRRDRRGVRRRRRDPASDGHEHRGERESDPRTAAGDERDHHRIDVGARASRALGRDHHDDARPADRRDRVEAVVRIPRVGIMEG